ncbi:MAG: peroxiredoxin [Myxococcota bacterium]|jgi:peroxiredoxin
MARVGFGGTHRSRSIRTPKFGGPPARARTDVGRRSGRVLRLGRALLRSDSGWAVSIADQRGKVVYLYFFQSWCPGCHKRGFSTLKTVSETFRNDDQVAFIAIQTVFEGFGTNTAKRAKETADSFGLTCPVGHDGSEETGKPGVMGRYRSGGTPWTVIVDKTGLVRFNGFAIKPRLAINLIHTLRSAH